MPEQKQYIDECLEKASRQQYAQIAHVSNVKLLMEQIEEVRMELAGKVSNAKDWVRHYNRPYIVSVGHPYKDRRIFNFAIDAEKIAQSHERVKDVYVIYTDADKTSY